MKRILEMVMIFMLAMATIFIDYSFAEKPIDYNRFIATKAQIEEGTPITIHGEARNIAHHQTQWRTDNKLTAVYFNALDKEGNKRIDNFQAVFLVEKNELFTNNYSVPYDPTMLDRILDFIENDTKVEIRGIMVKTGIGPGLVIKTIEPLEATPKAEKQSIKSPYFLTIILLDEEGNPKSDKNLKIPLKRSSENQKVFYGKVGTTMFILEKE